MSTTKLEELVERYGNLKGEMDSYKKQVDSDNKEIKSIMSTTGVNEISAGGYVAKYSVAISESFDEEKLIKGLTSKLYDGKSAYDLGIIKHKEYVDMTALEDAIYNGKINAAELADCKVRKETPRLTITKEKTNGREN